MKRALEDINFEKIKAHFVDPENSELSEAEQEQVNRVLSMAKLLDRYPTQKTAVAIHMHKYDSIKRSQAYEDCRIAMRLFNTIHNFDYDFWHQWLLNDIVRNIERCKKIKADPKAYRVIAIEHLNLIRALGEKPPEKIDPSLVEKKTFIIPIQINNEIFNFDLDKFRKLPETIKKQVADALVSEIKDIDAETIMNT